MGRRRCISGIYLKLRQLVDDSDGGSLPGTSRMAAPSTIALATRSQGGIATLRNGVLIEDSVGRIAAVNQAFCRIWKIPFDAAALVGSPAALVGRPTEAVLAEPARALARLQRSARIASPSSRRRCG